MNFFCFVKNFCLMVMLLVVTDACAMELVPYQSQADKFVREFPLMTLKRAHCRYNECNACAKAEIEKQITEKEDKCFSGMFNVATKIPAEVHMEVVRQLFNNNMVPAEKFLEMPIRDAFEIYAWTQNVSEGKEVEAFIKSIRVSDTSSKKSVRKNIFDTGILFQYANEIKAVNSWLFEPREDFCRADRRVLEAMCILDQKIKEINPNALIHSRDIAYRYYDTYTVANFFNEFKKRNGVCIAYSCCMAPIITAWISRYIELNYCQKMLTESDAAWNKDAIIYNEWLKKLSSDETCIKTMESDFRKLTEGHYSFSDFFKINVPFFAFFPSVDFCGSRAEVYYKHRSFVSFSCPDRLDLLLTVGIGAALMALSHLRYDDFPVGFLGMFGGVSAYFLGIACIMNLIEMRRPHRSPVKLEDIGQLLEKHRDGHIVIE